MPVLNQANLDDTLAWDACTGFSGGQVSNMRANLLATNQVSNLLNCDITQTGALITRRGTQLVGSNLVGYGVGPIQGIAFYDTPSTQYLVCVAGARLWWFNGSVWAPLYDGAWRALDALRPVVFAQGIDLLYISDGAGNLLSWDGTTLVDLSGGPNPPPVGARFMAWHTSRLVLAGFPPQSDAIYFSDLLDGSSWDFSLQEMRVGAGDGDPIVAIVPWTNFDLLVLKRHSIWVVGCDPTNAPADHPGAISQFPVTMLNKRIGCIAPRSAVQVGDDVFFLSDTGVRSVQRSVATEDRAELADSLSYPIDDVIQRINNSAVSSCCATYWRNRYFLAVPLDEATSPNYVIVYNTLTETWSGLWMGWYPTDFTVSAYGGSLRLVIAASGGGVYEWLDWVHVDSEVDATFQDNGQPIISSIETRAFTFSEPVSPKTGFNVELEFDGSTSSDVDLQVVIDGQAPSDLESFTTLPNGVTLPVTPPFTLPKSGILRRAFDIQRLGQFRELQFVLQSASGKIGLRTISASAFIDTMEIQE